MDRAMQHTGGQGATVAARGRFSVEWLPPASAAARPAESHLSQLIPLNPGESRFQYFVFCASRACGTDCDRLSSAPDNGIVARSSAAGGAPV